MSISRRGYGITLLVFFFFISLWSFAGAYDRFTWWLEALPALAGAIILAATYRRFPLSRFCCLVIFFHAVVLLVGAHYTYAREPFFEFLKESFHLQRNYYDRLGHFMQGFSPAILSYEILTRLSVVNGEKWRNLFVVCLCLSISAFYELIEWWVALSTGSASDDFIGSQGDIWDTQNDMMMALIGAICAVLLARRFHLRSMKKIDS